MISLKRFLENKYHIQIPDNKATPEAFDSVNKIATYEGHVIRARSIGGFPQEGPVLTG
jgi:hypothetical protein